MKNDIYIRSDTNLFLFSFPVAIESADKLGELEDNVDYMENLSQRLYHIQIQNGASPQCEKIQRMWDTYLTFKAMKKVCQFHQVYDSPSFMENNLIFMGIKPIPQDLILQSLLHTTFNKPNNQIEIVNVATSPVNIPLEIPLKISYPGGVKPIKGAGTFILENAITVMHKHHPGRRVYIESRSTGVPFLKNKMNFEILGTNEDITALALSKDKVGKIAGRVLSNIL